MTGGLSPGFCSVVNLSVWGSPLSSASKFQSAQKVEGLCSKRPDDLPGVTQKVAEPGFKASKSNLNRWVL